VYSPLPGAPPSMALKVWKYKRISIKE
jgi:hypothetical protein